MARKTCLVINEPTPRNSRRLGLGDFTGMVFNYWTVLGKASNLGVHKAWECQCKCGVVKPVTQISLRVGSSKSCGCFQKTGNTWTIEQHRESKRKWKAKTKYWRIDNPKRRLTAKQQMPSWADQTQISEWYRAAEVLSRGGVMFTVDHIVPLRGKNVCGFHSHNNMQILPAYLNEKKSNSFSFEDIP